ncbi:murein hydrolase activator EnvC family protein [Clostridium omnivorum]|uniref:Metalloendopeptidase n=1 Tax=Clostridium omnivorum TaxID=1604902 RepID=A0ABQ5N377_9CLOT|nr:peptidoglycan DD-metalloendopeptidase family protein [Clostridium sp. E14]GLC29663.1 metalloendopeptidase [Clostridium sp. E14]
MRRVLSLILCFILAGGITVKADDLKDAQNQLNKVQDSLKIKKEELNNINKNKQKVEQDIKSLDTSMTSAASKVDSLNDSIVQLNSEVVTSQKELEKAQKEYNEQAQVFRERARAIYISGTTSYLDVFFSSKDFSDMLTRFEYVKRIMDYDRNLLKNMEYAKQNLEGWKAEVARKKTTTLSLKQQADAEVKNLQELTDKKKDIMKDLDNDKTAYEKAIAEEEAQSKNIAALIKQKEADKKKQDEEAKKQQNGGKTPTDKPKPGTPTFNGKYYKILDGSYRITSPYGYRIHPILNRRILHTGIDIAVGTGTAVHALADGKIIYAGWMSGYGNVVMIDHGNIISLYAHNSSISVGEGQQVKGGQVVCHSGSTGNSTGPHLHFEIRQANGETVDPMGYSPINVIKN